MTFISFITPTIGRMTLDSRTIPSIQAQDDDDWRGVVICDGWERTYEGPSPDDRRFNWIYSDEGSAGMSRNVGIAYAAAHHDPEWVGFVDDDDAIHPMYVKHLRFADDDTDVVVFRMQYPDGRVLPDLAAPMIEWGHVGISFAVRTNWFPTVVFRAEDLDNPGPDSNEDIKLLLDLQARGARIALSPLIGYFVNHYPWENS